MHNYGIYILLKTIENVCLGTSMPTEWALLDNLFMIALLPFNKAHGQVFCNKKEASRAFVRRQTGDIERKESHRPVSTL